MTYNHQIDFQNPPGSVNRPPYNYELHGSDTDPVVTIITPFYNTNSIFHETVRSVLGQSFQQWEWIIVNDGSSDPESLAVLDCYRSADSRIRIIDLSDNQGPGKARNLAVSYARTDFIVNIDSDDLLEPTAIEKLFWFLISYPQFSFSQSYSVGFGAQAYLWQSGPHNAERYLLENQLNPNGIIRRSVFLEVGGLDETIRDGLEDWDFWLRCASKGYWGSTIPEYLIWYRRRDNHNDRWKNWDKGDRQRRFARLLRQKYPDLWVRGMPKVHRHQPAPYDSVNDDLPATNILKSSKSRLLMIVPWLEMGGADKFNLDLLRELTQRYDYEVTILTTLVGNNSWYYEFAKYTPDIFILDHFLHLSDYPRFIRYVIQSRQIKTVLISNSEFAYHILPYLRSHFPDVAFIDYLHMEEEYWKNGGYPRLSLINQSQLDLTIVSSQHLKTWMTDRGAPEDKIEVCTTNIDPDDWNPGRYDRSALREAMGIGECQPVILYSGRLVDQKQPMLAAEVFLELKRLRVPFVALVAGEGPLFSALASFFERHQMTEVRMLGAVSNERMRELLAISDIFFLPSLQEGISLAIYEAMAMGVTPVAANVGGQAELVTPDCGILVHRGPSERTDYVQALTFLLTNLEQCREMGRRARERICNHFRLEHMSRRMLELFDEAHRRHRVAATPPPDIAFGREIATRAVEMTRLQMLADWLWVEREQLQHTLPLRFCLKRIASPVYRRIARINPGAAAFMLNTARRISSSWRVRRIAQMVAAKLLQ